VGPGVQYPRVSTCVAGKLGYNSDMANPDDFGAFELLLRPLRREMSVEVADALLRLKADESLQARYDELASKNTESALTPEERAELESLVRANSLLSVLKAEARAFLHRPKAA